MGTLNLEWAGKKNEYKEKNLVQLKTSASASAYFGILSASFQRIAVVSPPLKDLTVVDS